MNGEWHSLRINGERLWARLMTMAQVGATPKGGVCRVALTDADKAGRDLFVEWCKDAGLTVKVDQMGNIFARRAGADDTLPPVLAGSHLDSQPTGGKFDGALGVLAALEVVETLNDHAIVTGAPVEIVSWTNEEGARFAPAMIASGVFAGVFSLEYGLSRADQEGRTIGEELQRIGYTGDFPCQSRPFAAAFELHIEQGPILETEGKQIGIVTGVQGMRWYELVIEGKEAHAGPTPMDHRRDPVQHALPVLAGLYDLARQYAPHARVTIGNIQAEPGVINTVPGRLQMTLDLRHPEATVLDAMDAQCKSIVQQANAADGISAHLHEIWYSPPVAFDPQCIQTIREAARRLGLSAMELVSGAGHDAVYVSRVVPTGMIFVPCKDGLSHNEAESIEPADAVAGANVLLQAMLHYAQISDEVRDDHKC